MLGVSKNTVETHVKQLVHRLTVARRTACVSKARAVGLLD